MNLRDEHNNQKLMELLDGMKLSEENRRLAELYLDVSQNQEEGILEKVEKQDFSGLEEEKRRAGREYIWHLEKRGRKEELERYVRFMAAVGGSTAYYVLGYDGKEYLTEEQRASILAEGVVWKVNTLNTWNLSELFETGAGNREVLKGAMELCQHEYANAKVLLAAILLCSVKPEGERMKEEKEKRAVHETADFLEKNLLSSIPNLFPEPAPARDELEPLFSFIHSASQDCLSEEAAALIRGKQFSAYLVSLLAGAAFLAQEHSQKFVRFLWLMLEMDFEVTLSACKNISPSKGNWFSRHIPLLEDFMGACLERYIQWCLRNKTGGILRRLAAREPLAYRRVVEDGNTSTEDYRTLMKGAKEGNPELYQELEASLGAKYEFRLAHELALCLPVGTLEARDYLLGEAQLETLYPFVNAWRGMTSYQMYRSQAELKQIVYTNPELYSRGVILMALSMQGNFLGSSFYRATKDKELLKEKLRQELEKLLGNFEEKGLPVGYQTDALGAIWEASYNGEWKALFMDTCVEALSSRRKAHIEAVRTGAREATAAGRGICIRVLDYFWREEKETLFSCLTDTSKQVREILLVVFVSHQEWEEEIKKLLFSKKSQERELAVLTMRAWGVKKYEQLFMQVLEKEKSKKLKELLADCLGVKAEAAENTFGGVQQLAAEILKGGKGRKVSWAFETPFLPVHTKQGEVAEEKQLQAILVAYADKNIPGSSKEAKQLAEELDEKELARFAAELLNRWLEGGAEAKKKWVLYAASIHGGEGLVPVFWRQIQDWAQHSRGALAAEAVKALALNGSAQALLQVDQIARKFKFKQVKAAAAEALETAAGELGISRQELEDKIVPDLGFDERMRRVFDYGERRFNVYLTPSLELEIFDEGEKRLKNLPAPGKRDNEEKAKASYEEFKQFKKQLKIVAANQKQRLEYALSAERLWKTDKWKELFVSNPVMHQFAIGLIWGIYEEGKLRKTFRYMEDGSFTTQEEEELELPENVSIGLVHPIELESEALEGWKEQLRDYEITQPLEQLERPVYRVSKEEREEEELARFGGKLLNGLSLSGKLQSMGWYRGSVEDAGVYYTFYREDGELGAELEFSGAFVGDENDEITVFGLSFYKAGTVKRGSYVYDKIRKENRYTLGEISPRYFSEIVLQMERATVSSQEQLPYPECRERR